MQEELGVFLAEFKKEFSKIFLRHEDSLEALLENPQVEIVEYFLMKFIDEFVQKS